MLKRHPIVFSSILSVLVTTSGVGPSLAAPPIAAPAAAPPVTPPISTTTPVVAPAAPAAPVVPTTAPVTTAPAAPVVAPAAPAAPAAAPAAPVVTANPPVSVTAPAPAAPSVSPVSAAPATPSVVANPAAPVTAPVVSGGPAVPVAPTLPAGSTVPVTPPPGAPAGIAPIIPLGIKGASATSAASEASGTPPAATQPGQPTAPITDFRVTIVMDPSQTIQDLKWDPSKASQNPLVQSTQSPKPGMPEHYVMTKGEYSVKFTELLFQGKKVMINPNGEFFLMVPINSPMREETLVAIHANGTLEKQKIKFLFPGWAEFKKKQLLKPYKKLMFSAGLGLTGLSYRQTEAIELTQMGLTAKCSLDYPLKPNKWEMGASTYFTAMPLSSSVEGSTIRFVGVNARIGYQLTPPESLWKLVLMTGWYFVTTIPSEDTFGFQNVSGPQFLGKFSRRIADTRVLFTYFKYSPISDGLQFLALTNTESAFGGGISFRPKNFQHWISVTIDLAFLKLNFGGSEIYLNSYSLGASYQF